MKLGKKLEVVNHRDRAKLLIDGVRIYTEFKGEIYSLEFNEECLYDDDDEDFLLVTDKKGSNIYFYDYEYKNIWNLDWYYPVETYTVNGVELEDFRVKEVDLNKKSRPIYLSNLVDVGLYTITSNRKVKIELNKLYIERNLLHTAKEAAISHSKALLGISE